MKIPHINSAADAFEYLHLYFHNLKDKKCLLWINPANFDPFEENIRIQNSRISVPIRHTRFDIRLGPYLVLLDLSKDDDIEIFRASVNIAWTACTLENLLAFRGQPIAGWITLQSSAQFMAHYWARQCHLHRRGKFIKLLRFHDASVREWLWPILNARQKDILLGPADNIFSIGRNQQIQFQTKSLSMPHQDLTCSFYLDEDQWSQVEDYAALHSAWVSYMETNNNRNYEFGWEKDIFQSLKNATAYGISDEQSRELFALHALQSGPNFHTEKKFLSIWEKTKTGEYYGRALQESKIEE